MGVIRSVTFSDYMHQRVTRKNQNLIVLTVGGTGSGKTYSQLSEAERYYKKYKNKEFPIDHVCFTAKQLMQLINSGTLERGDVIIYEEVGINQSSRNWYSIINKMINYLLQSFRNMNIILFMNTRDTSFLDAQTRKLLHFIFETMGIDINNKICRIKPLEVQVNSRTGKVYQKYLRVRINGKTMPLKRILYPLPSKKLKDAYEERKSFYTIQLNKQILEDIEKEERKNLKCKRCGHKWTTKTNSISKTCPNCQSRKWNIPKSEENANEN